MKKLTAIILAALLALIVTCAMAENKPQSIVSGDWRYQVQEDGTAIITWYDGYEQDIVIPDTLDGYRVTALGSMSVYGSTWARSVTIPDSVVSFVDNPFSGCVSLHTIIISPDHPVLEMIDGMLYTRTDKKLVCRPRGIPGFSCSVAEGTEIIGKTAFAACESLMFIQFPDSLKSIDDYAFARCSGLHTLILPEGVTTIGDSAFHLNTNLKFVSVPASVTSIHDFSFFGCHENLILDTVPGSYGESFAREHGLMPE